MLHDGIPRSVEDYLQQLEARLSELELGPGSAGVPPGSMIQYGGEWIPEGWLACVGQAVDREEYEELYAAIGDRFGAGDGVTTFNLPNITDSTLNVRTIIRT